MKLDFSLIDADQFGGQLGRRVGTYLASDWIVSGTYSLSGRALPQQIRVEVHLRRAQTGATMLRLSETSGVHGLSRLVRRVGDDVRARMGAEAGPCPSRRLRGRCSPLTRRRPDSMPKEWY